jgi:hypothetical protein
VSADCPACAGVAGARHSCPGSGTFLAAEAHVAGEVDEIAAAWPRWQATVHLRLAAPDEEAARQSLTHFVRDVMADGAVDELDFAIEAYEVKA